jgi:hypothetical protein
MAGISVVPGTWADAAEGTGAAERSGTADSDIRNLRRSAPEACAIAYLPGPATSTDISITLKNYAAQSLIAAILDPFGAYNRRSLVLDRTFVNWPDGGTATILYPGRPLGPEVLEFTGFDRGDSVVMSMEPHTYENQDFVATVRNMDGTVIEIAYAGPLRCAGILSFDQRRGYSFAILRKTSP